jgi:hypothetical protein
VGMFGIGLPELLVVLALVVLVVWLLRRRQG